jgi:hypothetical protein
MLMNSKGIRDSSIHGLSKKFQSRLFGLKIEIWCFVRIRTILARGGEA